jgi:alpha-tubulin suppressor-like RCC1 family protein
MKAIYFLPLFFALAASCFGQGGPPNITTQPQSQTVTQGTMATFTVAVSSVSNPTYQWRFNGTNIPGANDTNYTILSCQPTNAGDYSVAITNAVGWAISTNATLTILGTPIIITQPANVTQPLTGIATFSVTASGPPTLIYQWRFNGNNIDGATDTSLKVANAQVWQAGLYSVVVSNSYGWAVSSNALLTVALPVGTACSWGNDSAGQATVPPATNYFSTQTFDTTGSVSDPQEPNHCGYPPCASYWLPFAPPLSGSLTVDTIGTTFNAILAVYTGTPYSNLTSVACSANHSSSGETVTFPAIGGLQYFVVIEGVNCVTGPATINFNLAVTFANGVKAIAAGGGHSLVLKTNGVVVGWGDNTFGQATAPAALSQVRSIAAGLTHSVALINDGSVAVWGDNSLGQTNLPPDLTNVVKIAAGANHTLALGTDGTVTAWGADADGQSDVPTTLSHVVLIAAGYHHSLALTADGALVGWGAGPNGETVAPPGLFGVVGLWAGDGFSVALRTNGTVVAWGDNTFGQTNIPNGLTGVAAISAGGYHCLALRNNGTVAAWGENTAGETNVPFVISTITAVSAGAHHSMTLKGSGAPVIVSQPVSQRVYPGATASFAVMAVGNPNLTFQWRFNGNNLVGESRNVFTRVNAQSADAGNYGVLVSNSLDSALSADAALVVGNSLVLSPLGFSQDGFKLLMTGPGGVYTVMASLDFFSWTSLGSTNAPPGAVVFTDPTTSGFARKYYRVLVQ